VVEVPRKSNATAPVTRRADDDLFKPEDDRPRHMTGEQWTKEVNARAYAASGIGDLFND
jgi:hypothetical protein